MQDHLIAQGVDLLLYGMGTVYFFLSLMVAVTTLMSRLLARYAPEDMPPVASTDLARHEAPVDPRIVSIIREAIRQHRSKR